MLWNKYCVCHCQKTDPSKFDDSRFKAWRVGYSRHSFTTWFSSLPEYRLDWILKVIVSLQLFFYSQGIWTLNHPTTFMERISFELNLKGYQGLFFSATILLSMWFLNELELSSAFTVIVLISSTIFSVDSLTSNCSQFSWSTGISSHFFSTGIPSQQWLKTNLIQGLDYNAKRH